MRKLGLPCDMSVMPYEKLPIYMLIWLSLMVALIHTLRCVLSAFMLIHYHHAMCDYFDIVILYFVIYCTDRFTQRDNDTKFIYI